MLSGAMKTFCCGGLFSFKDREGYLRAFWEYLGVIIMESLESPEVGWGWEGGF